MTEEWRDIPGYEDFYQVSSFGNVRSVNRYVTRSDGKVLFLKGRVLTTFGSTTCNYKEVQLSRDSVPKKYMVHRLVAVCFLGLDVNSDLEVNHKNGNKFDNRICNLEIVTHKQNIKHSIDTMLKKDYGEKHVHAKLTNQQADDIRRMWWNGIKQVDMANMYGVCKQVINNIVHYKSYIK